MTTKISDKERELMAEVERLKTKWDRSVTLNMSLEQENNKLSKALDVVLADSLRYEHSKINPLLSCRLVTMAYGRISEWVRVTPTHETYHLIA